MLKYTGMCYRNVLVFHKKSLDMGPIFKKKSLEMGPISQKLQKKIISAVFEVGNSTEVGSNCENWKGKQHNNTVK